MTKAKAVTAPTPDELRVLYPKTTVEQVQFMKSAATAWATHKKAGGTKGVDEPVVLQAFNQWKQEGSPMAHDRRNKTKAGGGMKRARAGRAEAPTDRVQLEALVLRICVEQSITSGSAVSPAVRATGVSLNGGLGRDVFKALVDSGRYTSPKKLLPVLPLTAPAKRAAAKTTPKVAAATADKKAAAQAVADKKAGRAPVAAAAARKATAPKDVTPIPKAPKKAAAKKAAARKAVR